MPNQIQENWKSLVDAIRSGSLDFDQRLEKVREWMNQPSVAPVPIWFPEAAESNDSNVALWQRELGMDRYAEFHRWSVDNREEFWRQSLSRLTIRLNRQPDEILDLSQGASRPAWLVGATLNITESCFHDNDEQTAIVAQRPGGSLRTWSYAELKARASQVANSLVDHGFKVGDAIGVVMPMTDWSVAIYLGVVMAGCHIVSIADSFAPPEIATRLNIAGAKAVFTYDHQLRAGKQLDLFRKVAEATEVPAIVLSTGECLSLDIRDQDFAWSEFLVDRTTFEPVVGTVNETINVLFSSGTTGEPKAIPWNHLTPIKCAIDAHVHQNVKPNDVLAWPTNLGWMMGPWLIFASLINKATIALYEDAPMGPGFGKFVEEAGVTMLGVVPTIVKAWQNSGDMESFDWSAIKVFSSTGESSQVDTMVYLSTLADVKPIIEYCGGTEIGGGYVSSVVVLPNYPAAFNTASVGLDFVLVDDPDDPKACDEGEVFLIPPSIGLSVRLVNRDHFQTYYEGTPEIDGCGQLRRHGDYFRKTACLSGHVFVAGGRSDDTMNLGGIKTSSAEIERVLNQINGVVETAAVAHASNGGPSELVVFVVNEDRIDVTDQQTEMNSRLKQQLNPLFRIRKLIPIAAMPRTASGKVMRRELRSRLNEA